MSAKEDLRVQRTRKLLSETLLDMMENESIEHISVIDLCNSAMINRGTFYKHFEDKYDLLNFALEELKRELYADFVKAKRPEDSPKEALRSFFEITIAFFLNNRSRVSNIVKNNFGGRVITAVEESIAVSLKNRLSAYEESYKIAVPIPVLSQFITGGLVTTMLWCINEKKTYPFEQYLDYLQSKCADSLFERI